MTFSNLTANLADQLADKFAEYVWEHHIDTLAEMATELMVEHDIYPSEDEGYELLSELIQRVRIQAVQ